VALFESRWGLHVDMPLTLDKPDTFTWDGVADVVVVGLGGAGVAAALESVERGLSVIAVDRYEGGGSSAANGGVFYAGGGTRIQKDAGESDTPEEMFKYLKFETENVISDETLRRFCEESPETVDWLMKHGTKFQGSVYKKKTSYPPLDYFLYHPDSTLAEPYASLAKPAARGHRTFGRNGKKAWGLGAILYNPLRESALKKGMTFHKYAEARQLAVDSTGRVIGVQVLQIPGDSAAARQFGTYIAAANKWMAMLPPTLPGSFITYGLGAWYLKRAAHIEATHRQPRWFRARKGVVLSAGGFILNNPMIQHFAPKYTKVMPNGTLGDTGTGLMLGASVGGKLDLMERVSSWRMINPPKAWSDGILVNARGARFVNETYYGAAIGDAMVEKNDGRGYIILDRNLRNQALKQAFSPDILPFQRDITLVNVLFAAKKAQTPDDLADVMGFDRATFHQTIETNNRAARGEIPDPFHKRPEDMAELTAGPYYAVDASADSKFFPLASMTVGGLAVDEPTGRVKNAAGQAIPGLYAAGRNAVGLCSHLYVSGLSYADCIFSGRRAARDMAG
jgi:3-oxo-5alpha-steroid 4-dehydrogenase